MKLHICCGEVYLKDYINIDIQGFVKQENVWKETNATTIDKYYVSPLSDIPRENRGDFVVDMKIDLLNCIWPWENNSIEEVVMIQAIEHFTREEGVYLLREICRILQQGGRFIFDFPDIIETFKLYSNNFDKLVRLIYCNHKDQYAIHKTAYTIDLFTKILNSICMWKSIEFKGVVPHEYPVIGGVAIKA